MYVATAEGRSNVQSFWHAVLVATPTLPRSRRCRSISLDPATLQSDLAKYGISAKVTSGSFCSSDPAPAGFSQVVSLPPREAPVPPQSGAQPTITFDPAAVPAGTELSVGFFQLTSGEQQASFALIDAGSYSCTSTPPGPAGPPDGSQLVYGGKGPAPAVP